LEPQNDLDRLALKHGSDKFGAHWYTPHYDRLFREMRDREAHILEIGIGGYDDPGAGGASLRMWRDYFPKGSIYGLDYFDKSKIAEERIKVFQGSQADPRVLSRIVESNPKNLFDAIIDDGSHRGEHVIFTFLAMFQFLSEGGWYVVEDTQTSYWPNHGGASDGSSGPLTILPFFRGLVDGVNWREIHRPGYAPTFFDQNILSIQFVHNIILIQKGRNVSPSNTLRNNRLPEP
jgi:hypothetical protein